MTAEDNFEPVAKVTTMPWPGNAEGEAKFTRPTMARFIVEDGDLPEIKEKASEALEAAGFPKTDRGKAEAICAFARRAMNYVSDAPMRESVYRPRYLLCVKGAKLCVKIGDCSNMNCALGALMRAAGLDVKVQGIEYGGGAQDHVNIVVYLADERKWAEADATTSAPVGSSSPGRKILYDPHDPKVTGAGVAGGVFIGAGRPMQALSMAQVLFGRDVQPVGRIGAGLVTPGDILAYRGAWNQYVLDTVGVSSSCAQAYLSLAAQKQASDPTTAATLRGIGTAMQTASDKLLADWNVWAGVSSSTIVLQGAAILQQQQGAVLEAGTVRDSVTKGTLTCTPTYVNSAGQTVTWAPGVDPSLQVQIISRIEGLGILASGLLQILVESSAVSLEAVGSAGQWAAQHVASTGSWLLSPWTWAIAGTLVFGTIGVVVWKSGDVARLVSAGYGHAMEHPKLRRRRRRRKMAA